ncbi:kinase-like domain-containing protein [Triangularia verruculosa]|uniref:non-specific serine/threonine protein kinase n=1 Tax=Triangularia verruculosa TaxID=2587418 RepID=A0AAN6XQW2_9PEZI|nr:kinase-like domain-containing protein [Triangularia verruculosa]
MAFLRQWARSLSTRTPLKPLTFPTTGFDLIPNDYTVEEEEFSPFSHGLFYPVRIGDVYNSQYQILGKLGYGTTSTIWLARNLLSHQHVTLKIYTRDRDHSDEFNLYSQINKANPSHPGSKFMRTAIDLFTIPQPGGKEHQCLVLKPAWRNWNQLTAFFPDNRFAPYLLKPGLQQLFQALDYLHTECKLIHTDIKPDNILLDLVDTSLFNTFTQSELTSPAPRKITTVNDTETTVYLSRTFSLPSNNQYGNNLLSDFGHAARGDVEHDYSCQPDYYRSPEVILEAPWSYPIDIWNIGVMIWDILQPTPLFSTQDPPRLQEDYTPRAHLASIVSLLGPPPADLLARGKHSHLVFDPTGSWIVDGDINILPQQQQQKTLEELEGRFEKGSREQEEFVQFMRCMLQWRPEDRWTAEELGVHPWIWDE